MRTGDCAMATSYLFEACADCLAGDGCPGNGARFRLHVRLFRGNSNFQSFQSVFTGDAGGLAGENGLHEVADFGEIGVSKASEKMVGENAVAAVSGEESYGSLLKASDEDGTL